MHKRDAFFYDKFLKRAEERIFEFHVGEIRLVTTGLVRASLFCETLGTIEGGFNVTLKTSGAPLYQSFPFLDNCFCLSGLAARSFAVSLRFWHRFLPFLLSSKPPYLPETPSSSLGEHSRALSLFVSHFFHSPSLFLSLFLSPIFSSSLSFALSLSLYPVITSPIAFIDLPITVLSRYNGVATSGPTTFVYRRLT